MADPLRRRLRAGVLRGLQGASPLLPAPLLGGALGLAAAAARRGELGRRARRNLELAYGEELSAAGRERILRAVFRHSARLFASWLRLGRSAPPEGPDAARGAWIEECVTIDPSIGRLEEVLAAGRGAIVVSAHLGDWELLCAALRRHGVRGDVVGLRRPRDPSTHWLVAVRRAYGVETHPQDGPPRALIQVLREGRVLGLVADLEVRRLDGEFLPFFGRPALTMTAPAALARVGGVPLVPVRCIAREGAEGQYVLSVEEPLWPDPALDRRTAARDLLLRMNRTFERWIRETPEQWAWHQHRWRTTPEEYEALRRAASRPGDAHGEGPS